MKGVAPLTPTALRTRWALLDLARGSRKSIRPNRPPTPGVSAPGLHFPAPLGLAAGFDRWGALVGRLAGLGLGAVEIGSVAAGSRDLARALQALRRRERRPGALLGISLVKRPATPWPQAGTELAAVLRHLAGLADYVALNPGRDRPEPALFAAQLGAVVRARDSLGHGHRVPVVAKLPAPWLACDDPAALAKLFAEHGADGLILATEPRAGLDAVDLLDVIRRALGPEFCLISVGGAATSRSVHERLQAGASLVQVHAALRRSDRRHWLARTLAGGRLCLADVSKFKPFRILRGNTRPSKSHVRTEQHPHPGRKPHHGRAPRQAGAVA